PRAAWIARHQCEGVVDGAGRYPRPERRPGAALRHRGAGGRDFRRAPVELDRAPGRFLARDARVAVECPGAATTGSGRIGSRPVGTHGSAVTWESATAPAARLRCGVLGEDR